MATWSHSVQTKEIHEWYVPNGNHTDLLQAIYQARQAIAAHRGVKEQDLFDTSVLFKAHDDGVIVYFEIEKPAVAR